MNRKAAEEHVLRVINGVTAAAAADGDGPINVPNIIQLCQTEIEGEAERRHFMNWMLYNAILSIGCEAAAEDDCPFELALMTSPRVHAFQQLDSE